MITIFIQGLLLGFGACVPIGPINILIISYALKSYKQALYIGLGAMSADVIYLLLINFGILQIIKYEIIKKSLAIFGFIFLNYVAYVIIKNSQNHIKIEEKSDQYSTKNIYIKGFLLTLLNPYTVGYWLSIASLSATKGMMSMTVLAIGVIGAILLWITIMPFLVWKNRRFISDNATRYLSITAGLILIFFAFVLIYNIFILELT